MGSAGAGRSCRKLNVRVGWEHGEPKRTLTDGVVAMRMPRADDAAALMGYAVLPGGLDGGWLPLCPPVSDAAARWVIEDWLAGWAGRRSHNGPALIVSLDGSPEMVGIVGFGRRGPGAVEMVYGVAPGWRRRGLAARAARLAAGWLMSALSVNEVELRIGSKHLQSRRVAVNAGFVEVGTVRDLVERTGEVYNDRRFIYAPHGRVGLLPRR